MDLNKYFKNRRTIRQYSDRKIEHSFLLDLLEAATQAPTTGNMQLYSVIITEDSEKKRMLAPAHFNQPSVTSAAAVLTFCADFNRFEKWCNQRNATPGYNNFQALIWAVEDTMIFAQQFVTIAEMNGLGTCYLGTTTYNAPQIAQLLELPDRVVPIATVTVGYPAVEGSVSDRLPIEGIIHNERYTDYTPEAIDHIYAEKETLPESSKFIAENNKENLAQVFTDIRYKKEDNEYFSKIFEEFIKAKGF